MDLPFPLADPQVISSPYFLRARIFRKAQRRFSRIRHVGQQFRKGRKPITDPRNIEAFLRIVFFTERAMRLVVPLNVSSLLTEVGFHEFMRRLHRELWDTAALSISEILGASKFQ